MTNEIPWSMIVTIVSTSVGYLITCLLAWGALKAQLVRMEGSVNTIKDAQAKMPTNDSMTLAIIKMRDEVQLKFLDELDKRVPHGRRRHDDAGES